MRKKALLTRVWVSGFGVLAGGIMSYSPLQGQVRSSTHYATTAESFLPGAASTSAHYANIGAFAPVGRGTSPGVTANHRGGYVSQLVEVKFVALTAPNTLNEGATSALTGVVHFEDATTYHGPASSHRWLNDTAALSALTPQGQATASIVYRPRSGHVLATHGGGLGAAFLTVNDNHTDNFGSYAGDGLHDGFQAFYFGENNPLAAPAIDFDNDQFDNRFEFMAGLNPTDPASFFLFDLDFSTSPAGQIHLRLNPKVSDRVYTYQKSLNLTAWSPMTSYTETNMGSHWLHRREQQRRAFVLQSRHRAGSWITRLHLAGWFWRRWFGRRRFQRRFGRRRRGQFASDRESRHPDQHGQLSQRRQSFLCRHGHGPERRHAFLSLHGQLQQSGRAGLEIHR